MTAGEVTVPEQGYFLFERPVRRQHAPHPPTAQAVHLRAIRALLLPPNFAALILIHAAELPALHRRPRDNTMRTHEIGLLLVIDQPVHGLFEAGGMKLVDLFRSSAETSPQKKVLGVSARELGGGQTRRRLRHIAGASACTEHQNGSDEAHVSTPVGNMAPIIYGSHY